MNKCVFKRTNFSFNSLHILPLHLKHKFDSLNIYTTSFQYMMDPSNVSDDMMDPSNVSDNMMDPSNLSDDMMDLSNVSDDMLRLLNLCLKQVHR